MVITIIIQKERWIITRKKGKREKEKLARKRDGLLNGYYRIQEMDYYRLLQNSRDYYMEKEKWMDYKKITGYQILLEREMDSSKEREITLFGKIKEKWIIGLLQREREIIKKRERNRWMDQNVRGIDYYRLLRDGYGIYVQREMDVFLQNYHQRDY